MTQDNQIVIMSTTTHGFLYHVYHKDDSERKTVLYFGEISNDNPKHDYCTCLAYVHGLDCYHQKTAKDIMEIKI